MLIFSTKFVNDEYRKYHNTKVELIDTPSWMKDKGFQNVKFYDGTTGTIYSAEIVSAQN